MSMKVPDLRPWQKIAVGVAGSAMAVMAVIGPSFEGAPHHGNVYPPYWDSIGRKWTQCFGETQGITQHSSNKTLAQCTALYQQSSKKYLDFARRALPPGTPEMRVGAIGDYCYNRGTTRCGSSMVITLLRQGKTEQGCDALLYSDRAQVIQGLFNRRYVERAFCLWAGP